MRNLKERLQMKWEWAISHIGMRLRSERGEFGISSLIGVAIGLIIAAFVLIPGVRAFAGKIMTDMGSWWNNVVSNQVFPN